MKFYKSVITITIIDSVPLVWNSLRDVVMAAENGVYKIDEISPVEITSSKAAEFALATDNDPGWLGIDKDGNSIL